MSVHPTDDLELYALGDLEASERSTIEAHLAQCATCRRAVGEAEETLAALADALPRYRM
ncbi:MAG: zf-HC2 domain-containing protein, partial [Candidatus Eremiobacteraeota bacterium]|nr:zf-HC2 domain-containing protein [Candidatus Eremiobacteraeota bacterium]